MIQKHLPTSDARARGIAASENPIPAKKKKRFQVRECRSCKHLTLTAGSNWFASRISYSNTAATRFLLELIGTETDAEMETEMGPQ